MEWIAIFRLVKKYGPYVLGVLVLAGMVWFIYEKGYAAGELAVQTRWDKETLARTEKTTIAIQTNRDKEQRGAKAVNQIDNQLQKGNDNADDHTSRLIADLRAGNKRLRNQLAARTCPAASAPTGAGSGNETEAAGLSTEDGEFLIRFAREADDVARQLNACQAVIQADRKLMNENQSDIQTSQP